MLYYFIVIKKENKKFVKIYQNNSANDTSLE